MKRGTINFIIDLVSFVNLLCLAVTGFIMRYILPPGSGGRGRMFRGGRGGQAGEQIRELWSMTRHEWGDIHFYPVRKKAPSPGRGKNIARVGSKAPRELSNGVYLAALFVILMLVHIILHWIWIKNYFKSLLGFSQKTTSH